MTYDEAIKQLPDGAEWSSSFGNPGEGGYAEYHRAPDGKRWQISNGRYHDIAPFEWAVCELLPVA